MKLDLLVAMPAGDLTETWPLVAAVGIVVRISEAVSEPTVMSGLLPKLVNHSGRQVRVL